MGIPHRRRAALAGGALVLLLAGTVGIVGVASAAGAAPGTEPGACGWLESDPPQPAPCPSDAAPSSDADSAVDSAAVGGAVGGPVVDSSVGDGPVVDDAAVTGSTGGDQQMPGSIGSAPAGDDPLSYWTPDRMAGAEPLPMEVPEPGAR